MGLVGRWAILLQLSICLCVCISEAHALAPQLGGLPCVGILSPHSFQGGAGTVQPSMSGLLAVQSAVGFALGLCGQNQGCGLIKMGKAA